MTTESDSLDDASTALARAAAVAGLSYAVIGGQAVNAWVRPRLTADVDFTAAPDLEAIGRLRRALEAEGWEVERQHGANLPSGPDFVRFIKPEMAPLEMQTGKTAYQEQMIARAAPSAGDGRPSNQLRVATPEDLVVLKLIAFRAKDRVDLIALLRRAPLDIDYIEHWCEVWEVSDRLERARGWSEEE